MGEGVSEVAARGRAFAAALRSDRRVLAALCACVAVGAGVAWWRAGSNAPGLPAASSPSTTVNAVAAVATTTTRPPAEIVVDVVGAVRRSGVVRVAGGARVVDAIAAAGGATSSADLARLNLAAPVADGSRIAVPNVGQAAPPVDPAAVSGGGGSGGSGDPAAGTTPSGPVDINTATAAQLDALPGIGPATAAAIVQDRSAHGPFRSVDDLGRVRGIGPAKLAQLHDLVTV